MPGKRLRRHDPPSSFPAATRARFTLSSRLAVLVLVSAGGLAYANSLSGPFIIDDGVTIVDNPHIRQLWPLSRALVTDRESPVAGRPLVNLSFAINYALGGLDVGGYHLVNLVLHVLCALLLFGVVRRTLVRPSLHLADRSTPIALATALLWLLHPLNTEAVDYVTQRTELMLGACYLLTFYAAIRAQDSSRSRWWLVLAVVACGLGMACKESMVTAPVMVWLYDRIFREGTRPTRWRFHAALAATWLVLVALSWSGPRIHSAGWSAGVSAWTYLLNQAVMIARYLRLTLWPADLVLTYGYPRPLTLGSVLPAATLVVALLGVTVVAWRLAPGLGFLGAWFFVTLAPTSSIVPIATEVGAERRMYLPLMALVLLGVLALDWLTRHLPALAARPRRQPVVWLVIVSTLAIGCGMATRSRNQEYQSGLTLARTVLARWPTGYAHLLLATEMISAGDHQAALGQLRQAVADAPRAEYALGVELMKADEWDAALDHLQAFVRKEPALLEVVSARNLIGRILMRRGELDAAADQFRLVLQMAPRFGDAHRNLADALAAGRRFPDAIDEYQRYVSDHPRDAGALRNLGVAFQKMGRSAEAIVAFRQVLSVDPADGVAARDAAIAELTLENYTDTVAFARQALQANPDDAVAHDLLGLGLGYQSHFDEAVPEFQRAVQLSPADVDFQQHLAAAERNRHRH